MAGPGDPAAGRPDHPAVTPSRPDGPKVLPGRPIPGPNLPAAEAAPSPAAIGRPRGREAGCRRLGGSRPAVARPRAPAVGAADRPAPSTPPTSTMARPHPPATPTRPGGPGRAAARAPAARGGGRAPMVDDGPRPVRGPPGTGRSFCRPPVARWGPQAAGVCARRVAPRNHPAAGGPPGDHRPALRKTRRPERPLHRRPDDARGQDAVRAGQGDRSARPHRLLNEESPTSLPRATRLRPSAGAGAPDRPVCQGHRPAGPPGRSTGRPARCGAPRSRCPGRRWFCAGPKARSCSRTAETAPSRGRRRPSG